MANPRPPKASSSDTKPRPAAPPQTARVIVPSVVSVSVDEANIMLTEVQLVMEIVAICAGAPRPKRKPVDNRKVKGQCTAAGETVDAGSVVSVVVTEP